MHIALRNERRVAIADLIALSDSQSKRRRRRFQWIQLDASQQHQNQNDNKNQAEAATDIWTAAIKATTPNAAEPAKQRDD
jgi:hypothetical protein